MVTLFETTDRSLARSANGQRAFFGYRIHDRCVSICFIIFLNPSLHILPPTHPTNDDERTIRNATNFIHVRTRRE